MPNVSRSKSNQTMKFGQLIEHNMKHFCWKIIHKMWWRNFFQTVKLKRFNVNRPLFSVHSDLMCLWDLRNSGVIFCFFVLFWESGSFWGGSKTRVFLLPGVTKAKKPKPLYLIEFSLGEFVISTIASPLKFVQSLLFAFYTASASSPL